MLQLRYLRAVPARTQRQLGRRKLGVQPQLSEAVGKSLAGFLHVVGGGHGE